MPLVCAVLALLVITAVPSWATPPVTVPVVLHVITGDQGDLPDAVVREQLAVLNRAFAGAESPDAADTGFRFHLRATRHWHNPRWFTGASRPTTAREMKTATRVGGPDTLNVWTVDLPRLGYATLPSWYPKDPVMDGVVIDHTTVPGGTALNAGLGKTLVHEAGHWLGLWHTFENGCTALNDEVSDTPAQSGPSTGCPDARDSCAHPGPDPIHNYMDYSSDACYNQFTEGQAERMRSEWTAYREQRSRPLTG